MALALDDLISDMTDTAPELTALSRPDTGSQIDTGRRSLPDHLPREDVVSEFDHDDCPDCGGMLHAAGE